ncbi:hypothetical protein BGZ70_009406 [Mortierella alpina]|uniref:Transmembrane protein 198 n=1 Tax=Mortierella alpina TaxID=64518 RepID=A0A9P6J1E3_MORAP|nr:hypothetical protein BGZ70_009406 [Mortierella alpina]
MACLAHASIEQISITVDSVIVGIALIAAGFLFAFFGHKFFKITLFLAGFFTFSILVWLALAHLEPNKGYGSNAGWIYLGAGAAGGLIGGCLFLCFWRLGFAAIGGVAGFAFAMFILSWASSGVISHGTGRIIFIVVFVLVGILLTFFVERHIVILGTALVGAGAFFVGLDFFLHTGYKETFRAFLSGNHSALFGGYQVTGKVYGMLAGNLAMTVLGAAFQYWKHRDSFVPKSHRPQANRPYQEV